MLGSTDAQGLHNHTQKSSLLRYVEGWVSPQQYHLSPNVPTKHIPPVTNARMHHATPVAPPRLALLLAPTRILPLQNMTGCLPLAHICIFKHVLTCPCLPLAHVHGSSSYYKALLPNSIKAQTSPPPRFQLRKLATKARMKRFCIKSRRCIKGL